MDGKQLDFFAIADPERTGRRLGWRWLSWRRLTVAIALLCAGISIVLPQQTPAKSDRSGVSAESAESTKSRLLPVSVIELEQVNSYRIQREYTGEVKAARTSELGFERSGKLVSLGVRAGDRVTTGQAIARLDTQNLEANRNLLLAQKAQAAAVLSELQNGPRQEVIAAAQSRVADLTNQLVLQKKKQTRREKLYKEGAIAREDFDEVAFGAAALNDRLAEARSQLEELQTGTRPEQMMAQQAVLEQLDAQIADLEITIQKSTLQVPYSGTIGDRLIDEGTVVGAGQGVVRLVEGASPEVEIGIPAEAAAALVIGDRRPVTIGRQTYPAELVALKPEIDPATRTRSLVLQIDASAIEAVVPQQVARLMLEKTVPAQGYWVPVTALDRGDRGLWSVYAVMDGSEEGETGEGEIGEVETVERRDVEVLYSEGERALVRGTVQEGDRIIASGVQRIVPGQRVRAQSAAQQV